jgi:hypothetical protein
MSFCIRFKFGKFVRVSHIVICSLLDQVVCLYEYISRPIKLGLQVTYKLSNQVNSTCTSFVISYDRTYQCVGGLIEVYLRTFVYDLSDQVRSLFFQPFTFFSKILLHEFYGLQFFSYLISAAYTAVFLVIVPVQICELVWKHSKNLLL